MFKLIHETRSVFVIRCSQDMAWLGQRIALSAAAFNMAAAGLERGPLWPWQLWDSRTETLVACRKSLAVFSTPPFLDAQFAAKSRSPQLQHCHLCRPEGTVGLWGQTILSQSHCVAKGKTVLQPLRRDVGSFAVTCWRTCVRRPNAAEKAPKEVGIRFNLGTKGTRILIQMWFLWTLRCWRILQEVAGSLVWPFCGNRSWQALTAMLLLSREVARMNRCALQPCCLGNCNGSRSGCPLTGTDC